MKKILLALALIFALKDQAQNLNRAYHDKMDKPVNLVSINSKCYYLEHNGYGSSCCSDDNMRLVGLDNTAQVIFTVAVNNNYFSYENQYPVKLIKTSDKKLMIVGYSFTAPCFFNDYGSYLTNRIIKIDTTGTVLMDTVVHNIRSTALTENAVDVAEHANGLFYIATHDSVYKFSTGTKTSTLAFAGIRDIHSITALANGNLLLSIENNGFKSLVKATTTGSVVDQQTVMSVYSKIIESSSGDLYGLSVDGSIDRYSSYLFPSVSTSISAGGGAFTDIDVRNDTIFAAGFFLPGNRPFYSAFNSAFGVLYHTSSSYSNAIPTGIAVDNANRVNIITRSSSTNTIISYGNFYKMPIQGSFAAGPDIGVQSVSVSSCTFIPSVFQYFSTTSPVVVFDAAVTVINYSNDTIHSFCLNHTSNFHSLQVFCPDFFKRYVMTIPPNGQATVQTGPLYSNAIVGTGTLIANTPISIQECFFTTAPNDLGDSQISNDEACSQFTVTYITGIEAQILRDAGIAIYPNPFTASFTLKSGISIKTLEIYNVLGSLQYAQVVDASEVTIDQLALPAGVYFIKADTDKGSVVRKVIRE